MFFPLHWTILFNLSGIELYKFWMYSKGILSNSSWQNAQSSSKFLGCLWETLFFSRLQTFSIILMSGEFSGQFSRISNPFSENQVFERIELCAEALSCCNFSPKNISGNRNVAKSANIWSNLSFHRLFGDISDHRGQQNPKASIFFRQIFEFPIGSSFPFRYWVNDGLILVC